MSKHDNLRRLTDEEQEAAYWAHHPECYTFDEDGRIHFNPDAPERVVKSFLLMHKLCELSIDQKSFPDDFEGDIQPD